MQLREDEKTVDFDFEGAVTRENGDFLFVLIKISVKAEIVGGQVGVLDVVIRRLILADGEVLADGPSFSFDPVVELVVLGLVMPRAPVV